MPPKSPASRNTTEMSRSRFTPMREHMVMSLTPARMATPVRVRVRNRCSPPMDTRERTKAPRSRRLTVAPPKRGTVCREKNSG